ncbi:MAG TPA: hypothetical protein VJB06_00015, partial [archaeon]|nr:hypothetical protein [archaeon]
MTTKIREAFDKVYRNRLTGIDLLKTGLYSRAPERLFLRIPQRILNGEPLSLILLEDIVEYGHALKKNSVYRETERLGEVLSALAIATEIWRIDDLYRDLSSTEERRRLNRVVERNARLGKYMDRVCEENREWMPEEAQLILAGGNLGVESLLDAFADIVY